MYKAKGNNQYEMIPVTVGETENGFTEIISGEKISTQEFVVKGAYSLLMSQKNKSEE